MIDPIMRAALSGAALDNVTIVDAHAHICPSRTAGAYFNLSGAGGLVQTMDDIGIDVACISSIGADLDSSSVIAAVESFPSRLVGFAMFNPRYDDAPDHLERSLSLPRIRGIGEIHPTSYNHGYPITGPRYRPMWELAAESSVPVLVHSGPSSESSLCSPRMIGEVAQRYGVPVIIGHAAAFGADPWADLEEAMEVVRSVDNVFVDLAATARHLGIVEFVVNSIGDERVVFGSDAAFHSYEPEVAQIACAEISEQSKRRIFGLNMARLLSFTVGSTEP